MSKYNSKEFFKHFVFQTCQQSVLAISHQEAFPSQSIKIQVYDPIYCLLSRSKICFEKDLVLNLQL